MYSQSIDEFVDEVVENLGDDMDFAAGSQTAWYYWDAWHKRNGDFVFLGTQGPESLGLMPAMHRTSQFTEGWRRHTTKGLLYIRRFIWNGQNWDPHFCQIYDPLRNTASSSPSCFQGN